MDTAVCGDRFREMSNGRAVAAWELPGRDRGAASEMAGRLGASLAKPEFFGADMYMFHVTGFRPWRQARCVDDQFGRPPTRSSPWRRRCPFQHRDLRAQKQREPYVARIEAVLEDNSRSRRTRQLAGRDDPGQSQGDVQRSIADARSAGLAPVRSGQYSRAAAYVREAGLRYKI